MLMLVIGFYLGAGFTSFVAMLHTKPESARIQHVILAFCLCMFLWPIFEFFPINVKIKKESKDA